MATTSFKKIYQKLKPSAGLEVFDMTKVCQILTAFLPDNRLLEGRMGTDIRETLTLLACADRSTFCALLDTFSPFFGFFLSPSKSVLRLVPMERLRAIARIS